MAELGQFDPGTDHFMPSPDDSSIDDDELADLAFEPGFLPFPGLQLLGAFAFALEDLAEAFLQLLFPLADLCRHDVIFPGDLGGSLFPLDRFQGYPSFELGRQVSLFLFIRR